MPNADARQISENRRFQERLWRAERWAWVGFAAIILTGLLGLTGAGDPFARTSASAGAHQITYPRVARWHASDSITIVFAPAATQERAVLLSRAFGEAFSFQDAQPRPVRSEATAAGAELIFLVRPGERSEARLRMKGETPGIVNFTISVDGTPADVRIIVFP